MTLPGKASSAERWLWRALLVVLCLLAYAPSFSEKFIWDDDRHAARVELLRDADGLERIWTRLGIENGGTPQYYPLTHTTYWLEYQFYSLFGPETAQSAVGYRLVNALVHAGAAIMLWELLRRLRVPGAYLAAAVFVVHPVMVESVAWVSERKNTLSLLLGLTSLWLYAGFAGLRGEDEPDPTNALPTNTPPADAPPPAATDWNLYVLAVVAFAGAVLAKTMAAGVPVLLVLMLWWKRRLTARHLGLIAPLLLAAVGMGLLTGYIEHRHVIRPGGDAGAAEIESFGQWVGGLFSGGVSSGPEFDLPMGQKLMLAGVVPWFYAFKLLVPAQLVFFYPKWDLASASAVWWLGAVGVVGVVVGAVVAAARGVRWPLVLAVGYLVSIFPAMGFFEVYPFRYSYVADHFGYHAVWILVAAACAGVAVAVRRVTGGGLRPGAIIGATTALLLVLGARTWAHAGNFIDNYALWQSVIANNPQSWAATFNFALEKIRFAEESDRYRQGYLRDNNQRAAEAALQEKQDNLAEAKSLLQRVLTLKPDHDRVHYALGQIAVIENRTDDALAEFREQVEFNERQHEQTGKDLYAPAYAGVADMLFRKGQYNEALTYYRKAMSLETPYVKQIQPGLLRLAVLRTQVQLLALQQAAEQAARQSATTRPAGEASATTAPVNNNDELVALAQEVTRQLPENYEGWVLSGDVMFHAGDLPSAFVAYRQAMQLRETDTVLMAMGRTLVKLNRLEEAAAAFRGAAEKNPANTEAQRLAGLLEAAVARAKAARGEPTTAPGATSGNAPGAAPGVSPGTPAIPARP